MISSNQRYFRCFIAAPYGINLGVLPLLLGERRIAWNWSEDTPIGTRYAPTIQRCDFAVAVLDGSQSDQQVLYEVGLAEGLGKPVFIIATSKRVGNTARSLFAIVEVKLTDKTALGFHLDAFLSTPHETIFERDRPAITAQRVEPKESVAPSRASGSLLEARVYQAIIEVGGSAIVEPGDEKSGTRPDLLMWLGSQDPELFDPAVIEIKSRVDASGARRAEQQLLQFMQSAGVGCGILLTEQEPPQKRRPLSPYIFWLSVDHFVVLARNGKLGQHIRSLRNRAAHGAA